MVEMPRDNRCMYMAHVFIIYCSEGMGVCWNVCCVTVLNVAYTC